MKVIFITGASSGIGYDAARSLATQGHKVYAGARRTDRLEGLKEYGVTPLYIDVTDDASCMAAVQGILDAEGRIDVLVNNAGYGYFGAVENVPIDDARNQLEVNVFGLARLCQLVLPSMREHRSGRIINISSIWGERGASMEVAYSASKGGLNAFTRALAKEVAPSNIQVNAIACGVIDTEMNRCFSTEEMASIIEEIPADRLGLPSEVASLAVSLASAPAYLTGQVITIDGGFV